MERNDHVARQLLVIQRERAKAAKAQQQQAENEMKLTESMLDHSNQSGSSQSQDSIDTGHLHNGRRSSQLSVASNEHSEPSPGDLQQTHDAVDEEAKSGDTTQGRPPLFNIYGASSATADITDSNIVKPTTLSQPQFYRATREDNRSVNEESKGQQGEVGDEETKGDK